MISLELKNGFYLNFTDVLYRSGKMKSGYDFVDIDLIFKVN